MLRYRKPKTYVLCTYYFEYKVWDYKLNVHTVQCTILKEELLRYVYFSCNFISTEYLGIFMNNTMYKWKKHLISQAIVKMYNYQWIFVNILVSMLVESWVLLWIWHRHCGLALILTLCNTVCTMTRKRWERWDEERSMTQWCTCKKLLSDVHFQG